MFVFANIRFEANKKKVADIVQPRQDHVEWVDMLW